MKRKLQLLIPLLPPEPVRTYYEVALSHSLTTSILQTWILRICEVIPVILEPEKVRTKP